MAAPNDEENNDSANSQIPLPTEQNSTDNQASTDLPLIAAAGGHIFTNDPAVTLQARVEGVPGTVHYLPPGVCLQQVLTQASVYSTIDRLEALQANTSAPVSASDGQVATTATSTSEEQVSTSAAAPDSEKHGSTGGGIKNTPEKVTAVITSSESRATTLKSDTQDDIEATCSDSEGPDIPTPTSSEVDDMSSHEEGVVKVKLLPKPEGWKGDPGNPNFKTLGTISAPVMRKVEPVGPAYLQFARMVSVGRSNSPSCAYPA